MVMETLQIRLSHGMLSHLDGLVKTGLYTSRADAIRDAVRKSMMESIIGIIPDTGDSVKEIRVLREKLSKKDLNIEEINKLAD